jgi:simple sugar transport system ATP-binding protein
MEKDVVLSMSGIDKTFPGVKALSNVDFKLRKGEIHALMGENGAGKSTLIKVLTGVYELESGEIHMDGFDGPIVNHNPKEAQAHGISTVYQEVNLCPNLTVAENLFIGREPRRAGLIDWKKIRSDAASVLRNLDIDVDPDRQLSECSIAIQQMIAIARAVDQECKVLILDEPTSSLDDDEVEKLFDLMRRLRKDGVGIIFVTHFLEQVYAVCDRITVLRNGELVGEYETEKLPRLDLVAKMMGKDFNDLADIKSDHEIVIDDKTPVVIDAKGLGHKGTIRPFDLAIRKGEVIGLTGLLGSGRSELVRAIYGADKADEGELLVNGEKVKINKPLDAMKHGMAYLPEDRKKDGIIADLSVKENIIIALQAQRGMFHLMSKKEMEEAANKYIKLLQIKTASMETPIKSLSGGNQQKVIIARWLLTNPDYLILDEPTRGIDVGTKTEIQKLVLDLADEGKAVTFISSEIEEMLRTCSRMAVLRDGKKVGELSGEQLNQADIMKTIAGGESVQSEVKLDEEVAENGAAV